jgi:ligand-binding SRPBCC domain-containing protein
MSTHRLHAEQLVARPIEEVFAFFSRPENLARITPPGMGFDRLSDDADMRTGLEIDYRIRPLLGIPMRWRTRIDGYEPPFSFSDVQLRGPYRRWEHRHTFTSVPTGTLIEDDITYAPARAARRPRPPAGRSRPAAGDLPPPRTDHRRDLRDA